jgi:hypothetical protein
MLENLGLPLLFAPHSLMLLSTAAGPMSSEAFNLKGSSKNVLKVEMWMLRESVRSV